MRRSGVPGRNRPRGAASLAGADTEADEMKEHLRGLENLE
jgi:hypothetical protein